MPRGWPRDYAPVVIQNRSKGLSIFLIDDHNTLWRIDQDGSGAWDLDWTPMPRGWPNGQSAVVVQNRNNGLSVFLFDDSNHLWRIEQNAAGAWDPDWTQMPRGWPSTQPPVVVKNRDNGLSVFLIDHGNRLWRIEQNAAGVWDLAQMLRGWPRDQVPVVVQNRDNGLSVFLFDDSNHLWAIEQNAAGAWDPDWTQMPRDWPSTQPPVVVRNPAHSRRLSVFLVGDNGILYRIDQKPDRTWPADWDPTMGGTGVAGGGGWSINQAPAVAFNRTEGLSVFLIGADLHNLFRYDQNGQTGEWTIPPTSMAGDWLYDKPIVIGASEDGATSIFLIAKDERRGLVGRFLVGLAVYLGFVAGAITGGLLGLGALFGAAGAVEGVRGIKYLEDALSGKPILVRYDLLEPQIDVGYMVMAPATERPTRPLALQGTAIEAAFSFDDAMRFVHELMAILDARVDQQVYPSGWVSLRVTGPTKALLGMQQFARTGSVEIVLIGNPDDYAVISEIEDLVLRMNGVLHWGQSNGKLTAQYVAERFGGKANTWSRIQRELGDSTFRNHFMDRCGL